MNLCKNERPQTLSDLAVNSCLDVMASTFIWIHKIGVKLHIKEVAESKFATHFYQFSRTNILKVVVILNYKLPSADIYPSALMLAVFCRELDLFEKLPRHVCGKLLKLNEEKPCST